MADGKSFPAELAPAGQCDLLVDGGGVVISDQNHTINLRIEVSRLLIILSHRSSLYSGRGTMDGERR